MKLSFKRLPFYSVLIAAFVPWIDGITKLSVPGYILNFALIAIAGIALALNQDIRLRAYLSSWVFSALFCFGLVMLFILHRLHPFADFLVVVPVTVAYAIFVAHSAPTAGELLRQLKWLYVFHVSFIVLELFMFSFDSRHIFEILSGGRYRELTFHLLSALVLNLGNGAPNSLLLQTQAASHLVGSAFFVFYLASHAKHDRPNLAILVLLLLLFLLLITNTSLLVFAFVAVAVWMIRADLKTKISVSLLMLLAAYVFIDDILAVILFRAYGNNLFDYYLWYFTVPISNILDAEPLQFLFGHGPAKEALESGELGFATMAYVGGVYVIALLFIWLASILLAGFMCYRRSKNTPDSTVAAWNSLLFLNIVLCAAWAMSSVHYLIVLIPGGMHLFAFSLAIVITATARLGKVCRARPRDHSHANQVRRPYGDLSPG